MSEFLTIGTPPIEVRLKRNARAKRLTLRLSRVDGKATMTLPKRASLREARKFASKQEQWLRQQIASLPSREPLIDGADILYRGDLFILKTVEGRSVRINGCEIQVGGPDVAARLRAFMKLQARENLMPAIEKYSTQIGRLYNRVSLRDTRSRWGSCTTEGNLMFSWRLIMAPPRVLDYVVAHEVAHLVEMNHSTEFWQIVENLVPDYSNHRRWLREEGAKLHSLDFES